MPAANATWTDEGVIIKRYYNVGMAVALPMDEYGMGGLIVPVIKNAGDLNLHGAGAGGERTGRARPATASCTQEDLADGTFTLSNYGTSGSRFQTPIIVQPQVGILGVGAVEKRAVVVSQGHPLEANTGDSPGLHAHDHPGLQLRPPRARRRHRRRLLRRGQEAPGRLRRLTSQGTRNTQTKRAGRTIVSAPPFLFSVLIRS